MKIYVSSTKDDLEPYREAVLRAIRYLGYEPVAMEDYTSSSRTPLDKCLEDVKKCDLYVGIFAHRYGYVPPGQHQSITELEYRTAKQNSVPALIFLIHPDYPWPKPLMDRGEAEAKLEALKIDLETERTRALFTSPEDLALHVTTAISNEVNDMTKSLAPTPYPGQRMFTMAGTAKGTMDDLRRAARDAGDTYIQEMQRERVFLPKLYARRIELESQLLGFLDRQCTKSGLIIVGSSGIGKTNSLCHIVSEWREDPDKLGSDVVLLLGGSSLPGGNLQLRDALLNNLGIEGDFPTFVAAFESKREKTGTQLVVIVDGVDKNPQPAELLRQLDQLVIQGQSLHWLKVIISLGEVVYGALRKSVFVPTTRHYFTVSVNGPEGKRECAELILGRMTNEELREAYQKYRLEPGMSPKTPFESLTDNVKTAISDPLVLRIVMEVFNNRPIPRVILTAEVLGKYYENKVDRQRHPKREDFICRFVDLLYETRSGMASFEALRRDATLREHVLDVSPQSAYIQLRDEQVLAEKTERTNPVLPAQRSVTFTYDRLLDYLIAMRIADRFDTKPETLARLSHEAASYCPLRGAFTTLLLGKAEEGAFEDIAFALQAGNNELMEQVAMDVLLELEQILPTSEKTSDKDLDDSPVGRLVCAMLTRSPSWSVGILSKLGERLQNTGLYRRAGFVLERALGASRSLQDRQGEVDALLALGNLCTLRGEHVEAAKNYEQCRRVLDAHESLHHFRPRLLRGIANNLYRVGDLKRALACCDEWLRIYAGDEYRALRADMLRIRGVVLRWNFRLAEALQSYTEGAALAEQLDDNYLRAYFCNNIGEVHRRRGDLKQAMEWHERSRSIRQGIGDRSGLSMSDNNLSLLARGFGDQCKGQGYVRDAVHHYEEARTYLQEAIDIADEIGDQQRRADALNNLGTLMRIQDNYDEAERLYKESLALFAKGNAKNNMGIVHGNRAMMHHLRSQNQNALQEYVESRRLFEEAGNEAYAAYAYHNLAVIHILLGRTDDVASLRRLKEQVISRCVEYPWPDTLRSAEFSQLVEMPDI